MPEQPEFGGNAVSARVAGDAAVGGEHSVTADDDRHRVRADRAADRAGRPRLADRCGEPAVGGGLAPLEADELCPYGLLEGRAGESDRNVEVGALAVEVLDEFGTCAVEHGI